MTSCEPLNAVTLESGIIQKRPQNGESVKVSILGIDLSSRPRWVQFVACCCAVFVFYLLYGYLQEWLFKLPGFQPFGWYLTLVQFGVYGVFSWTEARVSRVGARQIPLRTYVQLALYTVATMGFSNASVGYLNYPTQVVFKCCKLIPVLIGGIVIQGKRYGLIDLAAAVCMSVGLAFFVLADSQLSPNFHPKGYVMISLALAADAVIGNVQEKAMRAYGAANAEVVLYSYSIGFGYILVLVAVSGELPAAFAFFYEVCDGGASERTAPPQHPLETYGYALAFSVVGYLGINVVLTMVRAFGALVAVTVTTCRKAVSIVLSFVLFAKPFTSQYVWSGLIVLFGIYLNVYSKNRQAFERRADDAVRRLLKWLRSSRRPPQFVHAI